jgi:hypothetical protein
MDIDDCARKIQRASERKHVHTDDCEPEETATHRHHADKDSAEAHAELTQPEHSKGRPLPEAGKGGRGRASNAGNDGP